MSKDEEKNGPHPLTKRMLNQNLPVTWMEYLNYKPIVAAKIENNFDRLQIFKDQQKLDPIPIQMLKSLNNNVCPSSGVLLNLNDDPATSPSELYLEIL
ncbi:hypothetical protein BB561_006267 [Smittium simulii]|uniref:Uncharacterized protein n=1 Tax=Smittium simulii TaxID=133385 RepID=A0A2T9Y5F6_9FUNG|nr:hypothetical protein BB561_006267 [Smittium simulii]